MTVLERTLSADLPPEELEDLLDELLSRRTCAALATSLLDGLRARPITAELLVAGATALRRHSVAVTTPVNRVLIDTTGAGDAGPSSVSVCTGAALLVAACDGTVANQADNTAAGRCGSVDVLTALGIPTDLDAGRAAAALDRAGFALLRTRRFHPALVRLAKELGLDSLPAFFRLLLPLANPAFPERQIVCVGDRALTEPMASALGKLGADRALVVYCGGAEEPGLHTDTVGHQWLDGRVRSFHQAGAHIPALALTGGDPVEGAARLARVFEGERGPLADAVAINAAVALWIGGVLPTLGDARRWARDRLAQGVDLDDFRS